MNRQEALDSLLTHDDPDVRAAGVIIREDYERRMRVLNMVKEALEQLRLDVKYIMFDRDATKRELEELRAQQ